MAFLRRALRLLIPLQSFVAISCGGRSSQPLCDNTDDGGAPSPPSNDPCPFAVLPGAPNSMFRNCSTRDGRTRAPAPASPRITWTNPAVPLAPYLDDPDVAAGWMASSAALSSDATGHVYLSALVTSAPGSLVERVDARDGTIDWADRLTGGDEVSSVVLRGASRAQLFDPSPSTIATFDVCSGDESTAASPVDVSAHPLIGSDGSFYIAVGGASASGVVSRISPDGTPLWTSAALSTFAPSSKDTVGGAGLVLAPDGTVLVDISVGNAGGFVTVVAALDPETGTARWQTVVPATEFCYPIVGPDGSFTFVVLTPNDDASAEETTQVVSLDRDGQVRFATTLPGWAAYMAAVALDGTILLNIEALENGIAALSPAGRLEWTQWFGQTSIMNATVASNGTVLVSADSVVALDLATGAVKWSLAPPNASPGVCDTTLSSSGSLVAVLCDGTLFGASD